MTHWFTSDTHFGHANIIKYCNRPFENVFDMNEEMIARWNAFVQPDDMVYHLGDFAMGNSHNALSIVKRLAGRKCLVLGNHDRKATPEFLRQWEWVKDLAEVVIEGQRIILCHYAMLVWNKSHHGSWQLHGHSHGTIPDDPCTRRLDVGVDVWDFVPVSFDAIRRRMETKQYRPVDHHGVE